ncbi:MAG: DNA repair protein RadC, partial [Acidisphaera sp.]|nr:DNA repair protein RadC [Acidisphaera sp.]
MTSSQDSNPVGRLDSQGVECFASTAPDGFHNPICEKLLRFGAHVLEDYELLKMLLLFSQPRDDTEPLTNAIIEVFGTFADVLSATPGELLALPGLTEQSVAILKLVQASALRLARAELMNRPVLNAYDRVTAYLQAVLARERVEQLRVLFLDTQNRLILDEMQSRGTVNHTPVYPREVIKRALELHATSIILVHNHPSGNPEPSRDDI